MSSALGSLLGFQGLTLAAVEVPLEWVIALGVVLFAIGLLGVASRRNVLIMLLSVEIMLNAANVVLVGFSRVHQDLSGQVFVFFTMTVAAAEVAVGLAIVIAVYRLRRTANVDEVADLREIDYGPIPPLVMVGEDQHHHDHDEHAETTGATAPAGSGGGA